MFKRSRMGTSPMYPKNISPPVEGNEPQPEEGGEEVVPPCVLYPISTAAGTLAAAKRPSVSGDTPLPRDHAVTVQGPG